MRLLVVEGDRSQARFYAMTLMEMGAAVDVAFAGREALLLAVLHQYDAILLSLQLPDLGGLEILEHLRREGVTAPILAITEPGGAPHIVRVLDAGADEFVLKPVGVEELRARVRALVRRAGHLKPAVLRMENLVLDSASHRVLVSDRPLQLTPKEFSLLRYFLQRPREVVSRTELLEKIWDMNFDPGSNVIDVHVSRLRSKLGEAGAALSIRSVRGVGFMLIPRAEGPPRAVTGGVA